MIDTVGSPPMTQNRTSALFAAVLTLAVVVVYLGLPSDPDVEYTNDYADHTALQVAGYPSSETLEVVQKAVWRMADGDAGRLSALATSDGSKTRALTNAKIWVEAFGKGAQGRVTAEFMGPAIDRQAVVLYFHDTGRRMALRLRLDGNAGEDGWKIGMNETDPKTATAEPTWAPTAPGTGVPLPPR